jgi:hypothetical protein
MNDLRSGDGRHELRAAFVDLSALDRLLSAPSFGPPPDIARGKLISQLGQCNPANEGQRAGHYNDDTGEHHDRRPQAWNGLLLHWFFVRSVPENEFGIS